MQSRFTKLFDLTPEPTIRIDRSQIPSVKTPGRTDYAYSFSAPPNHRLKVWLEWWKDGKLTIDNGFNDGLAPTRGEKVNATLHITMSDGKVAGPATAGQTRIDWVVGDGRGTSSRGDWKPDFFAGMRQTVTSWGDVEKWKPKVGETIMLLDIRGGTDSLLTGPVTDEGLRAGQWKTAMVLKARFEPVPESRLKAGPQLVGNPYRPAEHEPTPGLLRLAEQFAETLGPFTTAEDIRSMLSGRFKKTPEDRAKAEQMLRDAGLSFAPGEKPEELVKKLEAIPKSR